MAADGRPYPTGSTPPERSPLPVPPRVAARRSRRGRAEMKRDAAKRRLCIRFERGDTWW